MPEGPETVRLWRLVKRSRAAEAWDGEGAFRFGGRWNSRGVRIVYASRSLSLALLEVLVHLDPASALPALCALSIDLPSEAIRPSPVALPNGPSIHFPFNQGRSRTIGDAWALEAESSALAVPSAVVPSEENVLINPTHPDFARFKRSKPRPFFFDPRLGPGL